VLAAQAESAWVSTGASQPAEPGSDVTDQDIESGRKQ
jgi:hypothetical protein